MLNKVTLIGRTGADAELRYMPNGNPVANITLATTIRYKDKTSGERKESTEWHRVVFFNKLAEIVGEYIKKGALIYVEGRLQTRKWQGQDGQDRYTTEIIGSEMHMLGSKGDGQAASGPGQQSKPSEPQSRSTAPMPHDPNIPDYSDFDDDIPF